MASTTQELLPFNMGIKSSPSIAKLFDALSKAQGEFLSVEKDAENQGFKRGNRVAKYAEIASVIAATRPSLSKNGLAIIQSPRSGMVDGARCVVITTMLGHSSGEWLSDELAWPIEKGFTAHAVGSAVTYGRRYAMMAMLGVAGEDDDGNAASGEPASNAPHATETNEEFDQRTEGERNIPLFKVNAIKEACLRTKKTEAEALAYLNLLGEKRIEDLKNNQFDEFLKWANSTPKKADADPAKDDLPRKKAMATLFAVAAKNGVPENDLKQLTYEKYKVNSMTKLTTEQLVEVRQWVESVAAQHVEQ